MKGIELCEKYYLEYGAPMLEEKFPEYVNRIAVGICGQGSECLGFDDSLSHDHDFEPSFCLFLNEKDYEEISFQLQRAYSSLPKEFMGFKRQPVSPVGGDRRGVNSIGNFFIQTIGSPTLPQNLSDWFNIPSYGLLYATSGKIFRDDLGEFSNMQNSLKEGYPEDVRKKKISACLINMAQSGQYNYNRLIERGESGAGQLAIFEFVKHTISVVYLLNNAYEPFYKWAYKGMRNLPKLADLEFALMGLTELGNSKTQASEKAEIIEDICQMIIAELKAQGLTSATCNNLEKHAYSAQDKIADNHIRNMNIFEGLYR